MKIFDLRVNHVENPLGYNLEKLTFTWCVGDTDSQYQKDAKIQISLDEGFSDLVWESNGIIHAVGTTVDFVPKSETRYYYRVLVWGDQGDLAVSPTAWFETGLEQDQFTAKWIETVNNEEIHPYIFKNIEVEETVVKARAYVCGLGLYELEINGVKAGDEYLLPGYYDYHQWMQYQTFNISDLFQKGKNTIGICLGDGWYKGRFGYVDQLKEFYGKERKLICQITLELADGRIKTIQSDESWNYCESSILSSGIYDGETIDSRKFLNLDDGGASAKVKLCDNQNIRLQARINPPIRITERIKPIQVITTPLGEKVLDFGQNMTGWVEFDCEEASQSEIFLQFGEVLQDDCFYNENLRSAKQEFRYIANGSKTHVRPHFTFYGFRYVKVTGLDSIDTKNFEGCVIHSDLKIIGNITTSNSKINKLIENVRWGQRGNFLDVPTDCPQRDERLGWTGDAQVFAKTASFNMYTPAFFNKFMHDMLLEQRLLGGSVPHVVPDVLDLIMRKKGEKETFHGSCAWGDAAVIIPWEVYRFYGDVNLLEEHYENMTLWVDYIKEQDEKECGNRRLWNCGFHYADWLALDNPDSKGPYGKTDPYYVATAYYYLSAEITAKAAAVLNKKSDFEKYSQLASEIKKAFIEEYYEEKRLKQRTQTAHVLALYTGLYAEENRENIVLELKKLLEDNHLHLSTGFVGTPYLCPVLSDAGLSDYAYTLLLNEEFPGWLYEVNLGATTVWERWNSILEDGSISDTGMNSLNHYAYGSIAEWMYRYMCGLNPCEETPGFVKATIRPVIDPRLDWVALTYESAAGLYKIKWTLHEAIVCYEITIPFNATAEFIPEPGIEIFEIDGIRQDSHRSSIKFASGSYLIKGNRKSQI